ncbi:WD40 repeat protein [Kribbella voronezhensis]|uniref:WD40 repeat protein n=1 Tax=Kribbella voronezhensis TaxID=2512212 RepID=A0A4R7SXI4_9ACTN|nr:WD40 repeat domain-containing protein [Kribbella voronezhensis]TDU83994.1 WD40 repeat protein [Kribbella voronezhensis]
MSDGNALEVWSIGIGKYRDKSLERLAVTKEIRKIVKALADFGAVDVPWAAPMRERTSDAVHDRLKGWSRSGGSQSVVCWIGHGFTTEEQSVLAHAGSSAGSFAGCFTPQQLVEYIIDKEDESDDDQWILFVVDACGSATFIQELNYRVDQAAGPRRLLLLGTSGPGAATLGRLSRTLKAILEDTFAVDQSISLWDLCGELRRMLPDSEIVPKSIHDAFLVRRAPVLAGTTVDNLGRLKAVLAKLTDDERQHFVVKARGSELGDEAWYYQERPAESRAVLNWLMHTDSGLLAVTGPPGSGKSALLGQLAIRSQPNTRNLLATADLLLAVPADQRPPDNCFDVVVHLTGLTSDDLVSRIAHSLDLEPPVARLDDRIAWLLSGLKTRAPLTLLLDALDEAVDPLGMARTLLLPISRLSRIRLIIGTRPSTWMTDLSSASEGRDLLDALETSLDATVVVRRDPQAIARYVARRLADTVTSGQISADNSTVVSAAIAIGLERQEFLFARLLIAELRSAPATLTENAIDELLRLDHRQLFARALDRISATHRSAEPLLRALAMSRGRGLPIRDGIWAVMGTALSADAIVDDADVHRLLDAAAPYISVHREHQQTVYRFAHRTFEEYFASDSSVVERANAALTRGLLGSLRQSAEGTSNPYLVYHLSGHASAGGPDGWYELAVNNDVLDRLDSPTLLADALRSPITHLPPLIRAIVSAQHLLNTAGVGDRRGIIQLALARHRDRTSSLPALRGRWSVRWAELVQQQTLVTLTGHVKPITCITCIGHSGHHLVASGSSDGTVRLWNPLTAAPVGDPLLSKGTAVTAITTTMIRGQQLLLWGDKAGELHRWTEAAGVHLLARHDKPVTALAVVARSSERPLLASGHQDGAVRIHDIETGALLTSSRMAGPVRILVAWPEHALSIGTNDGVLWQWDDPLTTNQPTRSVRGHQRGIRAGAVLDDLDGSAQLLTTDNDGRVVHWGAPNAEPIELINQEYGVRAVAGAPDGTLRFATGDNSGTVSFWDGVGNKIAPSLTVHRGRVMAVDLVAPAKGRLLVVSGGEDATLRIWEPEPDAADDRADRSVRTLAEVRGSCPPRLVVHRNNGVELKDANGNNAPGFSIQNEIRSAHTSLAWSDPGGRVHVVTGTNQQTGAVEEYVDQQVRVVRVRGVALTTYVSDAGRTVLVSAGLDDLVQFVDLETLIPVRGPLRAPGNPIGTMTSLPGDDGVRLVTSGRRAPALLWNPAVADGAPTTMSGVPAATCLLAGRFTTAAQPVLAFATSDRTVRLWDPVASATFGDPLALEAQVAAMTTFESDGRIKLVAAARTGDIHVWDPRSGTPPQRLRTGLHVRAVAQAGDHGLAVAGHDGLAVLDLG